VRKLIPIILVIGVFLTACGGGGEKAETSVAGTTLAEESPVPMEVVAPTSVATATPVPTAAPTATPVPTPIPKSNPIFGPPPIVDLTVIYPDGVEITVPVYCPVPAEYCDSAVEVYNEEGNYLGLGFSLPEGTPIFVVGEGDLGRGGVSASCYDNSQADCVYGFDYWLIHTDYTYPNAYVDPNSGPVYKKADWADVLPEIRFVYSHYGFSTVFPNPVVINSELELIPEPMFDSSWVSGGQEIGRTSAPYEGEVFCGADGQYIYENGINFILAAESCCGYEPETTFQIYFNSQPTTALTVVDSTEPIPPEPISEPTLTIVLPDGTEVPIACPVPEGYCRTATELFRDDGSFYGLGFTLPVETPILAVADGKVEGGSNGWWSPANDPDKRYYPIAYSLTAGSLNFHYSYVNDSPVDPSSAEVEARQELGRVTRYGFDKCVNRCWAKFDPFNFIFRAEDCSTGGWSCPVLLIRVN